jgi:hypothetical protein
MQADAQNSPTLTVSIEAPLKREFGPEIAWVLRQALTTLGFCWREVEADAVGHCDIVYAEHRPQKPTRLWIPADRLLWTRAGLVRWAGISTDPCLGAATPDFAVVTGRETDRLGGGDPLFALYWLAAGLEESHVPRNRHGHLDFEGTAYLRDDPLRRATASQIVEALGNTLRHLGAKEPDPRWPNRKRAAFCCGHDVDYPEVVRWLEPARVLRRQGLRGIGNAVSVATGLKDHWNFIKWIDLEERYGLRSAFYFVPRRGSLHEYATTTPDPFYDIRHERFRTVIGQIVRREGEIGTHASYWAYRDLKAFRDEKRLLEAVTGAVVSGNRHHYWHLDPECPEATLLMHEHLGYEYDSSLTNERYLGWRRSLCTPFFPFHPGERREIATLQISTGWMDDQVFRYQALNAGDPEELLAGLVDTVAALRGCLMVDVHDYVFDSDLYPGWRHYYERLVQLVSSRRDFWLATPAEVSRHWRERCRRLVSASTGLDSGLPAQAGLSDNRPWPSDARAAEQPLFRHSL